MKQTLTAFILAGILSGCQSGDQVPGQVAARVGDEYLTREELSASMPPGLVADDSILWTRNYLNSWIEQEILYQYAQKSGLTQSGQLKAQLRETGKRLVVGFLTDSLLNSKVIPLNQDEIRSFYEQNKEDWVAGQAYYRVSWFSVSEVFDSKLVQTEYKTPEHWAVVTSKYGLKSERMTDSTGSILTGAELADLVNPVPVPTSASGRWLIVPGKGKADQSHVMMVRIHESVKKGEIMPLAFVIQDIQTRLQVKKRHEFLRQFTDSLRKTELIQLN